MDTKQSKYRNISTLYRTIDKWIANRANTEIYLHIERWIANKASTGLYLHIDR